MYLWLQKLTFGHFAHFTQTGSDKASYRTLQLHAFHCLTILVRLTCPWMQWVFVRLCEYQPIWGLEKQLHECSVTTKDRPRKNPSDRLHLFSSLIITILKKFINQLRSTRVVIYTTQMSLKTESNYRAISTPTQYNTPCTVCEILLFDLAIDNREFISVLLRSPVYLR